jgi:hypothetical protein
VLNKLSLNIKKCKCITFSRKISNINFNYVFDAQSIERSRVVNDLGVILDDKLTLNVHIDHIVSKAMRSLGFIKRFGQEFKDPFILRVLYCTYVRSILEFASSVWSPYYQCHNLRIEKVQRNFTRFALRCLNWIDRSNLPEYSVRCSLLNLCKLSDRRIMSDVMFIFDILSGRIFCSELLALINFNVNLHNTRNSNFIYLRAHRTAYGSNNAFDRCIRNFSEFYFLFDFNLSRDRFKTLINDYVKQI